MKLAQSERRENFEAFVLLGCFPLQVTYLLPNKVMTQEASDFSHGKRPKEQKWSPRKKLVWMIVTIIPRKNKGTEENNQDSPWLYLFSYVEQVGMNELMTFSNWRPRMILGTLSKPRWGRQRGHGKTKDLIGRTIAQHVRFKTLYIS